MKVIGTLNPAAQFTAPATRDLAGTMIRGTKQTRLVCVLTPVVSNSIRARAVCGIRCLPCGIQQLCQTCPFLRGFPDEGELL